MKTYFFYAFLLTGWILTSCQDDDSNGLDASVPFYQNLGVAYDITQNETRVGANFNQNNSEGQNIKLNGPASVLFNGKTPDFANIGVYFYTYSFKGLDDMTFTFTRAKDSVFTNIASLDDVSPIAIPQSFTSIPLNEAVVLAWVGEPLGDNESVEVRIVYSGGVYNKYNSEKGSTSLSISLSNSAPAGKATLSLSRIKKLPLQQSNGNAGGQLEVSYYQSKEITLK